jgi:hypothetical protein
MMPSWFPPLGKHRPGQPSTYIDYIRLQIATDDGFVRELYRRSHTDLFPAAERVGPEWAIFRNLQVDLFTGLWYVEKYGPDYEMECEDLHHTLLDMEYILVGVMAGAMASRDAFVMDKHAVS